MAWLENFWFGCGHCHGESGCPYVHGEEVSADGCDRGEAGTEVNVSRLVFPAIVVFVFPLVTAVLGAYLSGRWWPAESPDTLGWHQACGLAAGLVIGVVLARIILREGRRRVPSGRKGEEHDRCPA